MDDMNTRRSTGDNVIPLPYIVGDHIDDEQVREQFREQFKDIWNRIVESEAAIEPSLEQIDEEQVPLLVEGSITVRQEQQEPLSVDIRYKGYIEILCDEQKLSDIYSNLGCGVIDGYEFSVNEYLILKNLDSTVADVRKWNGEEFIEVKPRNMPSMAWGSGKNACKPLDEVQRCAFDSIQENEVTVLYGKAGCGKTHIPLAHILSWLESGKYDKLYVVYSYEPMRNAKTLGFEKGDHIDKVLMTGSIGNILASKLGSITEVERKINDGKLEIIPTANIRGVEFSRKSIVLVTEAQNLDVYTMKTIVQRCQEGCKQIYEGDILEQTDASLSNSGMARLIEVFKGNPNFGCVKLHKGYRSPLCELADLM